MVPTVKTWQMRNGTQYGYESLMYLQCQSFLCEGSSSKYFFSSNNVCTLVVKEQSMNHAHDLQQVFEERRDRPTAEGYGIGCIWSVRVTWQIPVASHS